MTHSHLVTIQVVPHCAAISATAELLLYMYTELLKFCEDVFDDRARIAGDAYIAKYSPASLCAVISFC